MNPWSCTHVTETGVLGSEPSTASAHHDDDSTQIATNDRTGPAVAHAEQVDAGEPDTAVKVTRDAIANSIDEVSEFKLKAEAGLQVGHHSRGQF